MSSQNKIIFCEKNSYNFAKRNIVGILRRFLAKFFSQNVANLFLRNVVKIFLQKSMNFFFANFTKICFQKVLDEIIFMTKLKLEFCGNTSTEAYRTSIVEYELCLIIFGDVNRSCVIKHDSRVVGSLRVVPAPIYIYIYIQIHTHI